MRQRRWEDVKSQSSRLHGNRIGSPWEEQEATDVLVPEIEGVVGRFYECPGGLSSTGRNTILAAPCPGEGRAGRQRVGCERGRRAVRTLACRGRRGPTPGAPGAAGWRLPWCLHLGRARWPDATQGHR